MLSLSRKLLSCSLQTAPKLISQPAAKKPLISPKLITHGFGQSEKVHFSNRVFNSKVYTRKVLIVVPEQKNIKPERLSARRAGVAAGSLLGLGTLCTIGPQIESKLGLIDKQEPWPSEVKQLISSTYCYFAVSLISTAAAAYKVARSPRVLSAVTSIGRTGAIAAFVALFGSSLMVHGSQYDPENVNQKHAALLLHSTVSGAIIAPLFLFGCPALIRAAAYAAGFCVGLCAFGACASSDEFFDRNATLAGSFGALFLGSIGKNFLPPPASIGMSLYSMWMHGVLAFFCVHMLYDTRRIVRKAKHSHLKQDSYDPINQSSTMFIYNDLILGSVNWMMTKLTKHN